MMKRIIPTIILALFVLSVSAQKTADFKFGLGYPIFTGIESTEAHSFVVKAVPALIFEKPLGIKTSRRDEKISINPGVSLMYMKEEENRKDFLPGGEEYFERLDNDLNHISLSGHVKVFYRQKLQRRREAFIYLGGVAGGQIVSKTIGTKITRSSGPGVTDETDINENGKDFFEAFQYGGIVGFQPDARITDRFKLSVEVAYYPNYVKLNNNKNQVSSQSQAVQNIGALMITVCLGLFN